MIKRLKELLHDVKHLNILKADVSIAEKNVNFWNKMYNKEHEKRTIAEYNLSEEQKKYEFLEDLFKLICDKYSIYRVYIDKESIEKSKVKITFDFDVSGKYDILNVYHDSKESEVEKND